MNDRDKLLKILHYDIITFYESVEKMTLEDAQKIDKIAKSFSIPNGHHVENVTLRNNCILYAIGKNKQESDFVLKASVLGIIFSDKEWLNKTADLNDAQRAYAFKTTEDNVIMWDMLNSRVKDLNKKNKQLKKSF